MVDDSIVRGNTMKRLVAALRHYGAKEIHLRSSSPPLRHPCHFGIDIPQEVELVAAGRSVQEVADYIGVDSLGYLSIAGLARAINSAERNVLNDDDETVTARLHHEFCYGCMEKKGWPFDPVGAQFIAPKRRDTLRLPRAEARCFTARFGNPRSSMMHPIGVKIGSEKRSYPVGAG